MISSAFTDNQTSRSEIHASIITLAIDLDHEIRGRQLKSAVARVSLPKTDFDLYVTDLVSTRCMITIPLGNTLQLGTVLDSAAADLPFESAHASTRQAPWPRKLQ